MLQTKLIIPHHNYPFPCFIMKHYLTPLCILRVVRVFIFIEFYNGYINNKGNEKKMTDLKLIKNEKKKTKKRTKADILKEKQYWILNRLQMLISPDEDDVKGELQSAINYIEQHEIGFAILLLSRVEFLWQLEDLRDEAKETLKLHPSSPNYEGGNDDY